MRGIQQEINTTNIGVYPDTAPSAVVFKGKVYLFYSGSGNDGIFYVVYDGIKWLPKPQQVKTLGSFPLGLAANTSPCAVSAFGSIYLFFNSVSNDGIFYSTSDDGQHWTTVSSVNAQLGSHITSTAHTSPSATVHTNKLYLFWNKGNTLHYATVSLFLGRFTWEGPMDVTARNLGLLPVRPIVFEEIALAKMQSQPMDSDYFVSLGRVLVSTMAEHS